MTKVYPEAASAFNFTCVLVALLPWLSKYLSIVMTRLDSRAKPTQLDQPSVSSGGLKSLHNLQLLAGNCPTL